MAVLALPPPDALQALVRELGAVASHQSAAGVWGIDLVRAVPEPHVTVGRNRSRCRRAGVHVHRCDLPAGDVVVRDGVLVTRPVRTVLDLCRVLPLGEAVAAADSALRARVLRHADLLAAVAALPTTSRHRSACREVLALVDPVSGSVLESLLRVLLEQAGLRPFETQHPVRVGGRLVGRVDFAWPEARLVVEVDGFAYHADRERYRSDRRRGNALVLAGWQVLRFSWEDVAGHPDVVVAQVRRALGR